MQCLWEGRGEGQESQEQSTALSALWTELLRQVCSSHLGNHLLPTTTEDLHTDPALLKGSLTLAALLKAAHKPARFKTGLEGTSMKNKLHKYPGYYLQ